ncbi:MAG: PIG-L deacetylase family protein [Dehalococcoidia bacterium]
MDAVRVLGIFPHPDDESYSCGGTFALMAARGAAVQLVCVTSGGAGQDLRSDSSAIAGIGATREQELRRACETLGLPPPRFLGLPDGALAQLDFAETAGTLIGEIRAERPDIVVTQGADGVYGHPDHIALHRLVVAAYLAAAGGTRFPSDRFGEPWAPRRLYFTAYPRDMFRPMYDHMLNSEYASAMRGLDPDTLGVDPPDVHAAIDIRAVVERKLAAIACHTSQLRDGDPATLFPGDLIRRLLTTELFTVGAGRLPERRYRALDEGLDS